MSQTRIELYGAQDDFFMCPDRFTAFVGGIGSGKTYAGAVKALQYAVKPKTLGLIVSPTYPMLKDATLRTFLELAGEAVESFNKSELIVKIKGGGEVFFRSAVNPDRLRGPNLNWAWVDEGALCPPGTWEIVIGRLRAGGKAGPCWITTTPKGRNWLYSRRAEMTVFKASTPENPYLSPEFVASLQAAYTGNFAAQEIYAEFVTFEGLVYPGFDRAVHVHERPLTDFHQFALALDEGYTHPAVILSIGIDADDRWHVILEYYERGKLQSAVVEQTRVRYLEYNAQQCAVDASAAGLIADLRDAGVPATPAKGRVLDGIAAIQNRLQTVGDNRPRLTVDPACVNIINEFESYVWKPTKDEPVKEFDHALDALRYLNVIIGQPAGASLVAFV